MIEKLLKEEEKNKVGRPKLADSYDIKKAKVYLFINLLSCFILIFLLISTIKGLSPLNYAFNLTIGKLTGKTLNEDAFMVKEYYDEDSNFVMNINTNNIDKYSGSYKYTTYYLKNNKWLKKETKDIERGKRNIKIKIESKENENVTWKIKFQIVNASSIKKSYAPFLWNFQDAKKNIDKYAYKVFTVKGYYSPITLNEIKEYKKDKNKIGVYTTKKEPRIFNINLPNGKYDIKIVYTDLNGKEVVLANDKEKENKASYKIPNIERSTKVTIKVISDINNKDEFNKMVLSNWKVDKSKNNNYYAINSYIVKPEKSYIK